MISVAATSMVRMGLRHHRAVNGPPGIDKKVAPLTVRAEVGRVEEWVFVQEPPALAHGHTGHGRFRIALVGSE